MTATDRNHYRVSGLAFHQYRSRGPLTGADDQIAFGKPALGVSAGLCGWGPWLYGVKVVMMMTDDETVPGSFGSSGPRGSVRRGRRSRTCWMMARCS